LTAADRDIRFNSLGFLPEMPKQATVAASCTSFNVRRTADNEIVLSGSPTGPISNQDTAEDVWIVDFSDLTAAGEYYLEVPGVGRSPAFPVRHDVYAFPFYTVMRGFYLWRCGTAVEGRHNDDVFSHAACHMNDGNELYITGKDEIRDGTGGWHDAGDYGKYVSNAGITLGLLFKAWEHFQPNLREFSLDIPETASDMPQYLQELKWETDWLLKMEYRDDSGRVAHKLTRKNFSGFIMPEDDHETRYFVPWGSMATADFAAMMAAAARVFQPYDAEYSELCLQAALRAYGFLTQNPAYHQADQTGFSTGGYESTDGDDRLWAAAEIWEATGDQQALADFEARAGNFRPKIDTDFDWGNVKNLGMLTYLESSRPGRNSELVQQIRESLVQAANLIVTRAQAHGYRRGLANYYWGANGTVARQTLLLQTANRVSPDSKYVHTALDAIAHLFGRNYHRRSYVTGLGIDPPLYPHDRRSGADDVAAPWPGYLVGGGWPGPKDWKDEEGSYQTNEIAVNWQAALVYALAGFLPGPEEAQTFAQLALGDGYEGVLLLTNPSENEWQGSLEAYRGNHDPWLVSIDTGESPPFPAVAAEIWISAQGARKVVVRPAPSETDTALGGYLVLRTTQPDTNGPLGVSYFYSLRPKGVLRDSVGVAPSTSARHFVLPVERTSRVDTGVAWTTARLQERFPVTFRLRGASGSLEAEEELDYTGHTAQFVGEIFESYFREQGGDFLGWLDINSPAPLFLTTLRLEYGSGGDFQLTATPPVARP
jgi:endoglucanase